MYEKISEHEIGFYVGGKITRSGEGPPPGLVYEMDIVNAELRGPKWARRVLLTVNAHQPTGGPVRVTIGIPLRTVRVTRVSDGRLCISGARYGKRPMYLWPHPDKREEAVAYSEKRRQQLLSQ